MYHRDSILWPIDCDRNFWYTWTGPGMSTQVTYPQQGPATKKATKFQDISELRSALRSQVPEVLTEGQYIWFIALSVSNNF